MIDEGSAKAWMLNQLGIAMKAYINRAFAIVEDNDIKIKSVIEDLGAVPQQSVASLDTSRRDHVKAKIIDLAIDRIDVSPNATDILGETQKPTLDANGSPIMQGMASIRGAQDDCE